MSKQSRALMLSIGMFIVGYGLYSYFRGGGLIALVIFSAGAYYFYNEEMKR